jgi:hypothetical protein
MKAWALDLSPETIRKSTIDVHHQRSERVHFFNEILIAVPFAQDLKLRELAKDNTQRLGKGRGARPRIGAEPIKRR